MKSFSDVLADYKTITKDSSSDNDSVGKILINTILRKILTAHKWSFHKDTQEITTIANQKFYALHRNVEKVLGVTATVNGVDYTPREIINDDTWRRLNRDADTVTSDIPQFWRVNPFTRHLEIYPPSSSAGDTIKVYYTKRFKGLSQAEITSSVDSYSGTVTITENSLSVAGTGTNFTDDMVDKWLKLTEDEQWYKITAVGSTTALTLATYFNSAYWGGSAVTNGYFTIAEMIPLPNGYEDLVILGAAAMYYRRHGENLEMAEEYEKLFQDGLLQLVRRDGTTEKKVLQSDRDIKNFMEVVNPNMYPRDLE